MKLDEVRKLSAFTLHYTPEDQGKMHELLYSLGIDPNHLYQELEMSSSFVDTHRDTSHPGAAVGLHSHDFYGMLYFRSGDTVEYLIGSERYRLCSGDIIFISPGVSHRPILKADMTQPYVRDVVWINADFMEKLLANFPYEVPLHQDYLIRTAGTRWEFLGELFQAGIYESERRLPGWEILVIANTMRIMVYLDRACRDHSADTMKAEKPELLDKVTAYIETHYAEHINVSDLSKRFFVSGSSISHQFKEKMGISVYHYITQRRLISAKLLIAEGIALEQVATRVGFSDYSAFYRAFKQEYGIPPRQYRSKNT